MITLLHWELGRDLEGCFYLLAICTNAHCGFNRGGPHFTPGNPDNTPYLWEVLRKVTQPSTYASTTQEVVIFQHTCVYWGIRECGCCGWVSWGSALLKFRILFGILDLGYLSWREPRIFATHVVPVS